MDPNCFSMAAAMGRSSGLTACRSASVAAGAADAVAALTPAAASAAWIARRVNSVTRLLLSLSPSWSRAVDVVKVQGCIRGIAAGVPSDQVAAGTSRTESGGRPAASAVRAPATNQ